MTRVYLLLAVFFEFGWGGGIRTPECQDQNLVPYHLATPQNMRIIYTEILTTMQGFGTEPFHFTRATALKQLVPYHLATPQYATKLYQTLCLFAIIKAMIVAISKLSGVIYKHIAKPILFKMTPDAAHSKMITAGSAVQKFGFLRWLMRWSWAYQNPEKLSQTLCGLEFQNPLGLSAGLDKNFEITGVVNAIGFGQMEGGSITFKPCSGNPKPWFYRLPKTKSIVVHVGLANQGATKNLKRLNKYADAQIGQMQMNVSVAYTNEEKTKTEKEAIADYVGTLNLIKKSRRTNLVTMNISCPNTYGGEPFTTPAKLEKLLSAVDRVGLEIPVFIKMPIDKTEAEFAALIDVILKHNVQGVTIANLFKDRKKAKLSDELPDSVPGSLSGKPTFEKSNQLIKLAYKKAGDKLVISGVGGVFSAEDAYEKIRAGASLVEMVTGLMFEGPQIVGQINRGLVKLLERDGYKNISEAVGTRTLERNRK